MIENNPSNVASAFEMLVEEVEAEIDFVNNVGARAFEARDYDRAKEALERAGTITSFRDRVRQIEVVAMEKFRRLVSCARGDWDSCGCDDRMTV